MGTGANVNAFFGIMTMIIAIPTGVKIFNWLFTMYRGRIHFTTPLLWFLAFMPAYVLGLMGATRRLDHYETSTGWHPFFVLICVGVLSIVIGIILQNIQLLVSILQRKQNRDVTGDPWNGRTLEWATTSPPPHYNFAVIPKVEQRDCTILDF